MLAETNGQPPPCAGRKARTALTSLMTSFAITSCSSGPVRELFMMPAPAAYEEAPAPFGIGADSGGEAARLDILFATNRDPARDKDEDPFYTGERGYLVRVGEARIALGDGELSWDEARKISLLKSRPDDFPLYVEEATEFGIIPDSVSVFTPPDAAPEERQRRAGRFAQAINAQLARGAVNDVFIYVHGYKVTFENPLLVSAELWHFLGNEGAFVAFSWPATPSRLAYFKDIETARVSAWALRKLIDYIGRETKASRIHVIGYSAGTRVVLTALHEMALSHAGEPAAEVRASTRLGNVILIGSDVDTGMFAGQILDGVLNVQQGLTIYGSPTDKALKVSRTVFSHSRMGQLRPESLDGPMRDFVVANPELMLVDVSGAVDPDDDNGHGYFRKSPWVSSDILMTLRYGLGPGDRGLMRNEGSSVWRFPDDYLQRFEAALERVNPELARQRASRRLTAEKPAVGRRAQP